MCGPTEWQEHADGNEISPPSRTGCAGLPVRRLARVLVGRLGQTPNVLPGDGGEGQALTCPAAMAGCRVRIWTSAFGQRGRLDAGQRAVLNNAMLQNKTIPLARVSRRMLRSPWSRKPS